MPRLLFRDAFGKSLSKIREKKTRRQICKKIAELKTNAPLGKKLFGYPYWSLHIGRFRAIYEMHRESGEIEVIDLLARKRKYRELREIK